jgi:23S rRNA (uracil1939-C5)-methyltransferase
MSRRPLREEAPQALAITDLSHDGRGVARTAEGKAIFVRGALAGERVLARRTARSRHFDEAEVLEVLEPSPDRVAPKCPHFGTCSGCVLQHLAPPRQIEAKQRVLLETLQRIGKVAPREVLPVLAGEAWGYRRKGRFSVRRVEKKGRTLVGFREHDPRFVAALQECHTVLPEIGALIPRLATLVDGLAIRSEVPQIEFIAGDRQAGGPGAQVALVLRHLVPLPDDDRARLVAFAEAEDVALFLQPAGVESVHALWPDPAPELAFRLEPWDVELAFQPLDFIQVNASLNTRMIARALDWLRAGPDSRVLDLFCGLGNFTLPLARQCADVTGVEGDAGLVARARANAARNGLGHVRFHVADLAQPLAGQPWLRAGYSHLLLDPPRSGADTLLQQLPLKSLQRIVYVSCHPGSLARDAGWLVHEAGWTLAAAGAMDMFPQTAHVESLAVFERR